MLGLGFFTLFAFGLAAVVGHSKISLPMREGLAATGRAGRILVEILECPMCFGFWIGFVVSAIWIPTWFAGGASEIGNRIAWSFVLQFYTAGTNYLLARFSGLTAPAYASSQSE